MTSPEFWAMRLPARDLARIDALARARGLSREDMLATLVTRGLELGEAAAQGGPAPLRTTDPMDAEPPSTPSPWLGWAILVLVVVLLALGTWVLLHVLDGRARSPVAPLTSGRPATSACPPAPPDSSPRPPDAAWSTTTAVRPVASPTNTARAAAAHPKQPRLKEIREPWGNK